MKSYTPLIPAALLALLLRAPLASLPVVDDVSFFDNGRLEAYLAWAGLAGVIVASLRRWQRVTLACASAVAGVIGAKLGSMWLMLQSAWERISLMRSQQSADELTEVVNQAKVLWGLPSIVIFVVLLLISAFRSASIAAGKGLPLQRSDIDL